MSVVAFRPYRVRRVVNSDFLGTPSTRFNREFADEDLSKSGITFEDIYGYAVDNMKLPERALAGYHIPYFDLNGDVLRDADNFNTMYRIRLKYPAFAKEQRYTQPSGEELSAYGLPSFLPYLYPCSELEGDTIYVTEGEKKTVSFIKNIQLPAFGIAGCSMWGNPNGTGGPHPWILDYLNRRGIKRVVIIPDGDIFRYDICRAYGTFAHALGQAGYEVALLNPPGKIDDLIVAWGSDAKHRVMEIPALNPNDLVQTPQSLATKYNLAFKTDNKGRVTIHQHTSNVTKLLRDHPAFPKVWLDEDTNKLMFGEDIMEAEKTEMILANHFQHNFGMEKITSHMVLQCARSLGREYKRSPMLDKIRGLVWDGKERLDTWLTNTWGVEDAQYTREIASKWLISSCARMDIPGSKVDWMFIAIGPQGTGKTSMPGIMFYGNNTTLYGEQNDKDFHLQLHSALVVGFDELDSFSRKEASMLKAMITRNQDMFRPPYGATVETFKRRFTLYGCGNRTEFLQADPSGQRRYAVIEVPRLLDFKLLEEIRDQLWAEAWVRYQDGKTNWWEIGNASEHAKQYEVANILQEQIEGWITAQFAAKQGANFDKEGNLLFTMSTLAGSLFQGENVSVAKAKEMGGILGGLGYKNKSIRRNGSVGRYYVIPRPSVA
jgi:Virulence-associated protein E